MEPPAETAKLFHIKMFYFMMEPQLYTEQQLLTI